MEINIFDMIFKIEDHEVSIIKNNISPWSWYSRNILTPRDVKDFFEWLFLEDKIMFKYNGGLIY